MTFEQRCVIVVIAFAIDVILKDPDYKFHPVRLIGKTVSHAEQIFYPLRNKYMAGTLCFFFLSSFLAYFLSYFEREMGVLRYFFVYSFIAAGQLWKEIGEIDLYLKQKSKEKARKKLSFLVTRDVSGFSSTDIVKTSLETLAENTCDAIFGPLFWYLLGGLPMLFAYKVIETGDSMVGYKTERYREFGFAFAKLDDVF